jgi:hypothetical protein
VGWRKKVTRKSHECWIARWERLPPGLIEGECFSPNDWAIGSKVSSARKGARRIMSREEKRLVERESEVSRVDALMRKLSQESPREAPHRVRLQIESAVQRWRPSQPLTGKRWLLAAAVLFAALALTMGTMISKRSDHSNPTSKVLAPVNPQPPVLEAHEVKPKTLPPGKVKRHQYPKVANPQPVFVRLPFSDPALMAGTSVTIRLALSDAQLLAMGVRPIESDPSRSYVADLVLGDDGLPRAIRIVSHGPRIDGGS